MDQQQEDCAICLDKPANCVVVPCGHQCGCEPCLNFLTSLSSRNKCPICRGPITSIMKVIRSGVQSENETTTKTLKRKNDNITLKVLPVNVADNKNEVTDAVVRISVSEPEEGSLSRLPVDVVAVIDISGSMGVDATYEEDNGEVGCDGLRILDIAVHSVKVILAGLRKEDRFALVAFDQIAELKYPLTTMTSRNRKEAVKVASSLKQRGQTNIWGGIEKGLDSLRTSKVDPKFPSRNQIILLLTDGQPTTTPRGGHIQAWKNYSQRYNFHCQLSCFGFGYSLDSKLMLELSQSGGGNFAFIPMAPVLGTVFTHALASVLSTYTTNSKLILTAPKSGGGSFVNQKIKGGIQMNLNLVTEKMEIDIGPLLFGQTRDIVVPMQFFGRRKRGKVVLEAKLEFEGGGNQVYGNRMKTVMVAKGEQIGYDSNAEVASLRTAMTDTLLKVVTLGERGKMYEAKNILRNLIKLMEDSNEANNERVVGLKNDVTGRCRKALDGRDRFNRWGKHYLRALLRAHSIQQCTNKLDIGVQVYGGNLFALMRQKGDEIFLKLPAPRPPSPCCPMCGKTCTRETIEAHTNRCMNGSGSSFGSSSSSSSSRNQRASPPSYTPPPPKPVNMTKYTGGGGGGGGCFGSESTVVVVNMFDKTEEHVVRVADVKKGDIVKVSNGNYNTAKVVCVVEYNRKDPKPLVAIPGGPFITSKHPVRVNGRWRMPEGMGPRVEAGENGTVYNFVLEPRNAILLVNGLECVSLGHGLKGSKVVEHEFYGTERSLNEVQKLKGWKNGKVSIGEIIRDEQGHAMGFK